MKVLLFFCLFISYISFLLTLRSLFSRKAYIWLLPFILSSFLIIESTASYIELKNNCYELLSFSSVFLLDILLLKKLLNRINHSTAHEKRALKNMSEGLFIEECERNKGVKVKGPDLKKFDL